MKKLKFILASILVLVMSFLFVACANDPLVGEWKAVSAIIDDEEISMEEYEEYHNFDSFSSSLKINADGTCQNEEICSGENGYEFISDGTYEFEDNILSVYLDEHLDENGEYYIIPTAEYKDGRLYLQLCSWSDDNIDSKVIYGYLIYEKQ